MILDRTWFIGEAGTSNARGLVLLGLSLTAFSTVKFAVADDAVKAETRTILVVDSEGEPVADANVTVNHWYTLKRDGKRYRLRGPLAPLTQTNSKGVARIAANRESWEEGTILVSKHLLDDETGELTYNKCARGRIQPDDKSIKVVMKDPVKVRGQVLIDGLPAARVEVCLTEKVPGTDFYGRRVGHFVQTDQDGKFELSAYAREEFSIEVMRRRKKVTTHFYHQSPSQKASDGRQSFGEVEVRSDQFLDQAGIVELNQKLSL